MKQIDLNTWEELENEVNTLYDFLKSRQNSPVSTVSTPLFRGQRSSSWNLSTTLERYLDRIVSVERYNHYLCNITPALEAFTGTKWEKVERDIRLDDRSFFVPPNYDLMVYVRHHGFPSPLLDWSQSLYIALFFAFQKASFKERVAIYVYVEDLGIGKGGWGGAPQICALGPYVSTHKRHFMQQGQYTVSVQKPENELVYCSHEKYFSTARDDDQDYLLKLTLPGDIKNQVLNGLQSMNINAFTLFGSEDSLMDMLAFKEMVSPGIFLREYGTNRRRENT